MWAFYVNRGQGIASFGWRDKDHAILEFQPANKAYRLTSTHGFRTFVKWGGRQGTTYEPFRWPVRSVRQCLQVTSEALALEDTATHLGLHTAVRYFTLPNEPMAALVRILTVTNRTRSPRTCELLDGLPVIAPFGSSDAYLKTMSRTLEAWYEVTNVPTAPVFRLRVDPQDRPDVTRVTQGFFYAAWVQRGDRLVALPVIVEPERVFGSVTDLTVPAAFWETPHFVVPRAPRVTDSTPTALAYLHTRLAAGASVQVISLIGHTRDEQTLRSYLRRVTPAFVAAKEHENQAIIHYLQDQLFTVTASRTFDGYVRQIFLDNLLRGGFPACVGHGDQATVVYLYGRKHGDLERDYNRFVVEPTPWSQGNAHYRDFNQNRRSDGWLEPRAAELNIKTFCSLIQLDGFNPFVYTGTRFRVQAAERVTAMLKSWIPETPLPTLLTSLAEGMTAGEVALWLDDRGLPRATQETCLAAILSVAERVECAEHGEGFWSDHWTYNLDLIEQFVELYPERLQELLFEEHYTTYDNAYVVVPRRNKYLLLNGTIQQLQAVQLDPAKQALLKRRERDAWWVRTQQGRGDMFRTSLTVKLLLLFANKLASLDPAGAGIEMEADKPNWFDALNGLPALFGSSTAETFELARGLRWLHAALQQAAQAEAVAIRCPVELVEFCRQLRHTLDTFRQNTRPERDLTYWEEATTAKETYREVVKHGISGEMRTLGGKELGEWLTLALERVEVALAKARDPRMHLYHTYYWYEPVAYEPLGTAEEGQPVTITIRRFRQHVLPLFLEGSVHALRYFRDPTQARTIHRAMQRSPLYDRKLKMYRVTAPLASAPVEIGRVRTFTPGWMERESIWIHMEYKYFLELLRCGLAKEFFASWRTAGIVHQPLKRYGRSSLENSSFLVSSVHPNPRLHGRGFVGRLTGSTAEFVHIWRLLMVGQAPFHGTTPETLTCTFRPCLPAEFFTTTPTVVTLTRRDGTSERVALPKHTVSFLLFGQALITYHNPQRRPTFGPRAVRPRRLHLEHPASFHCEGDTLPAPYALQLRDGQLTRLHIELG